MDSCTSWRAGDTYKTPSSSGTQASACRLFISHFTVEVKRPIFGAYVILLGQLSKYFLIHKFLFVNMYLSPM